MQYIKPLAFWLTVVGALNWGLIALLKINLVTVLFSAESTMASVIYIVIGASGLYVGVTALGKKK